MMELTEQNVYMCGLVTAIGQTWSDEEISLHIAKSDVLLTAQSIVGGRLRRNNLIIPKEWEDYSKEFSLSSLEGNWRLIWIRGYLEGRGRFIYENHKTFSKRTITYITCNTVNIANEIVNTLESYGLARATPMIVSQMKACVVRYYVRDTRKLYSLLYKDASVYTQSIRDKYEENN